MQELEQDAKAEVDESFEFWASQHKNIKIEAGAKPTDAFKQAYGDFFPAPLWYIWERIGFACFDNGGFWLVNPDDYADLLDTILKPTPFYNHDDWYVLGRTAFGDLVVIGRHTASKLSIDMNYIRIFPRIRDEYHLSQERHATTLTIAMDTDGMDEKTFDMADEQGKLLFDRCLASYGKLKADEIYTFVPALALGGMADFKHIQKANIFEHINFITQLQPFTVMMDINKVVDSLGITPESADAFVASQNTNHEPLAKYDETCIVQEGQTAQVAGYYQDRMSKKVIYLNVGDTAPIYPTPSHLAKSQAYIWYKLTEHGISLIPQETLTNAKKS